MPLLDEIDTSSSESDSNDFPTDDEEESESDHEEEDITWKKPLNWARTVRNNPLMSRLGDLVWKSPSKRDSVKSENIGLDTKPEFEIKAGDAFLPILLDALPRKAFFAKMLVRESVRYMQGAKELLSPRARPINASLFTVSNFLRLFAVVIMRGLVNAPDDPTFFKTQTHYKYIRTGAEEVCGLTLNQYQQLLRYMHLVDNKNKARPMDAEYDKCFHVRPLIDLLNDAFKRWFFPGTNNAVDEAGFPSRHHWLRSYNKTKPHKYFIELLMAACSKTKFVWNFFVNESSKKTVKRSNRAEGQSKFHKVDHFQNEFDENDRDVQRKHGPAAAQMIYFARKLREYDLPDDPDADFPSKYRIFTDRRWDSIAAIVLAKKNYGVSYTATVKNGHRFQVAYQFKKTAKKPGLFKSKKMGVRGKYRAAHTTIDNVRLATVLWVDSSLVAAISADLGTEAVQVERRYGRHKRPIDCPQMIFTRGLYFRAIDQHDQLRLYKKVNFVYISKKKAWLKLFFGLIELTLVNIYIVVGSTNPRYKDMTQVMFRWKMIGELIQEAERLEREHLEAEGPAAPADEIPADKTALQIREEGRDGSHHFDIQSEYVPRSIARENQRAVDANPSARPTQRRERRRDVDRLDGKVLNPFHTSTSTCIVCKFFFKKRKPTKTARYCRECFTDPSWPETTRVKG